MGMNVVTLVGRMCADPERKTTANGVVNCPFRLAVQRRFANANGERESDFINCKAWRGTAEFVAKYARAYPLIIGWRWRFNWCDDDC